MPDEDVVSMWPFLHWPIVCRAAGRGVAVVYMPCAVGDVSCVGGNVRDSHYLKEETAPIKRSDLYTGTSQVAWSKRADLAE